MQKLKAILKQALPVVVGLAIWEMGVKDLVSQVVGNVINN